MVRLESSLTIDLEGAEDILALEQKVLSEVRKKSAELLERAVYTREKQAREALGVCPECGGTNWESRGRVARKIVTLAGTLSLKRQRAQCGGCGFERYPLDETLKLKARQNATLGVIEQSVWLAVEMPYDRAAIGLRKIGMAGTVTGRQMQRWVKEEGQALDKKREEERLQVFEGGKIPEVLEKEVGRVFVSVDGTFVNKRVPAGEIEAKVGVIYSKKKRVARNRVRILDKRTFASIEGIESFREKFVLECERWGIGKAQEVIFSGDGAAWIKRFCRECFPQAIYLLDFWHLAENVRRAFGEPRRHETEAFLALARQGLGRALCDALLRYYRKSRDPDLREKLAGLLTYVRENIDGIDNYRKVGILGSSGAMEKSVDVTVCRRFKKRGMSWMNPGLSSLLALKLLKLNGEWNSYWRAKGLPL